RMHDAPAQQGTAAAAPPRTGGRRGSDRGNVSHAITRSEPGTHGRQRSGLLRARSTIAVVVAVLVFGAAWWSRAYFGSNPGAGTSRPPRFALYARRGGVAGNCEVADESMIEGRPADEST